MFRSYPKIGKSLSFPHALGGNPDEVTTGCPIKTFGHDNSGIGSNKTRSVKILILLFVLPLGRTGEVVACAVCYGTKASAVTSALNMAIVTLLIVFLGVLSCVAVFFWKVGKRIKMLEN